MRTLSVMSPTRDGIDATRRIVLPGGRAGVAQLSAWIHEVAQTGSLSERSAFRLELVLVEAVTNVVEHGGAGARDATIEVQVVREAGHIVAQVEDNGDAFDPTTAPLHRQPASLEEAPIGGLGMHLIRAYTQELAYRRIDQKNQLRMTLAIDG